MDIVFEATDLKKTFRSDAGETEVLRGVSFAVTVGSVVAVIGPSGSGKTTLLNLLSGLDTPTSGHVTVCGQRLDDLHGDAAADFRRRHIGFVFQFFNLIPTMSAEENVSLPLLAEGLARREVAARTAAALDAVGLAHKARQRASRLSGGEMQRVAIARAVVLNPRLVLADEPTGNLDSVTGDAILQLLCNTSRREGRAVLMVTHSHLAAAYADRVLVMRDGLIIEEVSPSEHRATLRALRD